MVIKEYVKEYTNGDRITFPDVFSEIKEFLAEVVRFNKAGVNEEFEDVFHFLQLWLYWRFGVNQEIWNITRNSVGKFMDRKKVWNKIYLSVGLPENISGYVGNYSKVEKVINHLKKLGINKDRAEEAYRRVLSEKR